MKKKQKKKKRRATPRPTPSLFSHITPEDLRQAKARALLETDALAALLGVSVSTVRGWLSGRTQINGDKVHTIYRHLGRFLAVTPDPRVSIKPKDLRAALKKSGVGSIAVISKDIGVSVRTFYHWISGRSKPTDRHLIALYRSCLGPYLPPPARFPKPDSIGEVFRQARIAQQWSLRDAAEAFGVSASAVHLWETNRLLPSAKKLEKYFKIFSPSLAKQYEALARKEKNDARSRRDLTVA